MIRLLLGMGRRRMSFDGCRSFINDQPRSSCISRICMSLVFLTLLSFKYLVPLVTDSENSDGAPKEER